MSNSLRRPSDSCKLLYDMMCAGATSGAVPFFINPEKDETGLDHLLNNKWVFGRY